MGKMVMKVIIQDSSAFKFKMAARVQITDGANPVIS